MHEHCVVLCLDFSQTKAQIAIHLANMKSSSQSPNTGYFMYLRRFMFSTLIFAFKKCSDSDNLIFFLSSSVFVGFELLMFLMDISTYRYVHFKEQNKEIN